MRVVKLRGVAYCDGRDVLGGEVHFARLERGEVLVADEQQRHALALVHFRALAAQRARVAQHNVELLARGLVRVEEALVHRAVLCLQGPCASEAARLAVSLQLEDAGRSGGGRAGQSVHAHSMTVSSHRYQPASATEAKE